MFYANCLRKSKEEKCCVSPPMSKSPSKMGKRNISNKTFITKISLKDLLTLEEENENENDITEPVSKVFFKQKTTMSLNKLTRSDFRKEKYKCISQDFSGYPILSHPNISHSPPRRRTTKLKVENFTVDFSRSKVPFSYLDLKREIQRDTTTIFTNLNIHSYSIKLRR